MWLVAILGILWYAVQVTGSILLAWGYVGILLVLSYNRPMVATGGWICTIPTQSYFLSHSGNAVLTLLAPMAAVIVGFGALRAVFTGRLYLARDRLIIALWLIPVGCLIASAANGYWTYAHLIGLVAAHVVLMTFISTVAKVDRNGLTVLVHACIVSAILVLFMALVEEATLHGRFGVAGRVRPAANTLGLAIVLIVAGLIDRRSGRPWIPAYARSSRLGIPLLLVLGVALAATVSRGVLLATTVACLIVGGGHMINVSRARGVRIRPGVLYGGLFVSGVLLVAVISGGQEIFGGETQALEERLQRNAADDPRIRIWTSTLSSMPSHGWLVGAGMNSFVDLSMLKGRMYYAHSVFVDAFVSGGLLALIPLLIFLAGMLGRSVRYRNLSAVCLITFTCLSYLTHGHLNVSAFWLTLVLVYALTYVTEINAPHPRDLGQSARPSSYALP